MNLSAPVPDSILVPNRHRQALKETGAATVSEIAWKLSNIVKNPGASFHRHLLSCDQPH